MTTNPTPSERSRRAWQSRKANQAASRRRLELRDFEPLTSQRLFAADVPALRAFGRSVPLAVHVLLLAAQRLLWWTFDEVGGVAMPSRLPPREVVVERKGGRKRFKPTLGVPLRLPAPARRALARAAKTSPQVDAGQ